MNKRPTMMATETSHAKPDVNMATALASIVCASCRGPFDGNQEIVNAKGETFHSHCFV